MIQQSYQTDHYSDHIANTIPQLIPFFFINQVVYGFVLLTIAVQMLSKQILPRFARIFVTRVSAFNI